MNISEIEMLVVIMTIQPFLLAWLLAICFFVSLAITAIVSPNRQWFEVVVIFGLTMLVISMMGLLLVQGIFGVEMIRLETVGSMRSDPRILPN